MENELFPRAKGSNEIFDTSVIKYTINIPIKDYERITRICREKHIHRSVWFRDAINRSFQTTHTVKELIDYEVMRRTGGIHFETPERILKVDEGSVRTDHPQHQHPGFIGRLMGNSFLYNFYRREKDQIEKYK